MEEAGGRLVHHLASLLGQPAQQLFGGRVELGGYVHDEVHKEISDTYYYYGYYGKYYKHYNNSETTSRG